MLNEEAQGKGVGSNGSMSQHSYRRLETIPYRGRRFATIQASSPKP